MLAYVMSSGLRGVRAYPLGVEVDVSQGLPSFEIVGLPDTSVRESRDRVRAALRNSSFPFPLRRVVINLTPADVRKEGPALDLPIALGILAACQAIPNKDPSEYAAVGELSLDGRVHSVMGIIPLVVRLLAAVRYVIVPEEQMSELSVLGSGRLIPVASLIDAVTAIKGDLSQYIRADVPVDTTVVEAVEVDMSEIIGAGICKRALEVAAAGGHHLLLAGPPGVGKTMLARCLPSILPPLTPDEVLEVISIHSAAGLDACNQRSRPFRSPHHSITPTAFLGGGQSIRPGELTLAHRGVLLMDELPEFRRDCIESMRQPLDRGSFTVGRARWTYTFPCSFQLIATANLCPCGNFGWTGDGKKCSCTARAIKAYLGRISGALLDRIDICVVVERQLDMTVTGQRGEPSSVVSERVDRCRKLQLERQQQANSQLQQAQIDAIGVDKRAKALLEKSTARLGLSMRAQLKTLRLARTIADMDGSESLLIDHLGEALALRCDLTTLIPKG